jgi:Ca-activated chloride channel family protein
MNAADVAPSRLGRARFEVLDLLRAADEGQAALVAFGPEPFVVSPLTGDAATIAAQVPQLSTDLLPVAGPRRTDLALAMAGELLRQAGALSGEVILVTDAPGELGPTEGAARALAAAGHRLSVLAVGTEAGAPVPEAGGGFAADGQGGIRLARLDTTGLSALARAGGGRYVGLEAGDRDIEALLDGGPIQGAEAAEPGLVADQWREEGPWLLLALLPVAALGFRRGWLAPAVLLALLLPPEPGWAADGSFGWADLWKRPDQQAADQLAAGDSAGAAVRFADPAWRAAAHYRAGDYEASLESIASETGADADYNRGNALARLGRLDEAIAAYEAALRKAPDLPDAHENLELVRRLRDQQPSSNPEGQQGADEPPPDGEESSPEDQQAGGSDQPKDGSQEDSESGGGQEGEGQPSPDGEQAGESGRADQPSGGQPESGADEGRGASEDSGGTGEESSGDSGGALSPGGEPGAEDFGADALSGGAGSAEPPDPSSEPDAEADGDGRRDADRAPGGEPVASAGQGELTPEEREQHQAIEAQLRRVPDDPAGLLRQRFLLQHLRRQGQLR